MKSVWFRAAAIGVAALLLTAAYKRAEPSSVMADAANAFLNSLWPDQKARVSYAFDDDERLSWHFVPTGANYKPGDRELRKGMVMPADHVWQRVFTVEMSESFERYFASRGVCFAKRAKVRSFSGKGAVSAAILSDGRELS